MKQPNQFLDSSTQTDAGLEDIANDAPIDRPAAPKKIHDTTWMLTNANEQQIALGIRLEDVQQSANQVTSKGGHELLCSYSWKQTDSPTIYVPGTPATFTFHDPTKTAIELAADTGLHWIDQHAGRVPTHQFEPVFQALAALQSDERFDDVDIVVNRGSLQQLLKWVNHKSHQAFHLDLDIVGNTLFLGRKVKKPKAASSADSYGRSFEEFFTIEDPELENADGHHRMLKYDFGGLNMVVRVEADACVPNTEYDIEAPVILHPACDPDSSNGLGISHKGPEVTSVIAKGTLIPQSLMIEPKSNEDTMPKEQLWFDRTPSCSLGRIRDNGKFRRLIGKTLSQADAEEWE
ncbi:hypothetical protein DE146DRAFT_722949 [Phaeosphaeria sp. MPI-PUGE-AT-0046c]|nr:hypothetical protein DE146DRAFT_722949 [Phaeosphaeria sp. MPI-PUGE-AT-0046c]